MVEPPSEDCDRPGFGGQQANLFRRHLVLTAIGLVWVLALASYGFQWYADPYDMRFARSAARLADHPYPRDVVPRLVWAAARGDADLVIVGGSTSRGFTPGMMRRAFPAARYPVNLSFPGINTAEMRFVLSRLERSPDLRRVIITIDWTLFDSRSPPQFDPRFFVRKWYDPAPEYNVESLTLSLAELRTHVLDLPSWRPRFPDRVEGATDAPPLTSSPAALAMISRELTRARGAVTAQPDVACTQAPAINEVVAPFVRRMAARGVAVDILAPPYALPFYYRAALRPGAYPNFAMIMALQRCAMEETAGLQNVRFHGLGADTNIVGNLSLYKDTGHLADYGTYATILARIAAGENVVTPAEWPAYEATLKREVDGFRAPLGRPVSGTLSASPSPD